MGTIKPEDIDLNDIQKQELDLRLNRYEQCETVFYKWEDIKNELNASK